MALISTGVLFPLAAGWSWLSPAVRAVVLAAAPLAIAGSTIAVLRWRHQPPSGAAGCCRAVVVVTVAGGVLLALGYNPFTDPRCELTCSDAPVALAGVLSTRSVTTIACLCTVTAAVIGAVGVARLTSAPRLIRGAGIATLGAFGAAWLIRWAPWAATTPLTDLERALPSLAAMTFGVAVCWQVLGTLHRRAAAGRLFEQLSEPTIGPAGRGGILAIHFASPDATQWLDAQGRQAQPMAAPCKHVILSDASGPVVRLALTPRADEYSVLSGFTPARGLALRNAQLLAVVNSHIAQVQDSGRRLVAVSDAERQRIERDLHDGAQQRLVSAAFHLKVARSLIGAVVPRELDTADQRLLDSLAQLRVIAHGMFPTALVEEGLTAALEELIAMADIPATLSADPKFIESDAAVDNGVAMAAFATVNAALRAVIDPSQAEGADISITRDSGTLTAQVRLRSRGQPVDPDRLTDAADRVVAAGGQLSVSRSESDQLVTAVIPCEW